MATAKMTKAEERANARQRYIETCEIITIDMDARGAFAVVPSEDGKRTYKVHFADLRDKASHATCCECEDYSWRSLRNPAHVCKHMTVVTNYHNRIHQTMRRIAPVAVTLKPLPAKPARRSAPNAALITELRITDGVKVRKVRGGGLEVKKPVVEELPKAA